LAVLSGVHVPDYMQIFRTAQAPASSLPAENRRAALSGAAQRLQCTGRPCESSDDLIGSRQQRLWNLEPHRVREAHVNHQLVLRYLFNGQISRLGTPEYLV